jgi:hypothetical protein
MVSLIALNCFINYSKANTSFLGKYWFNCIKKVKTKKPIEILIFGKELVTSITLVNASAGMM